MGTVINIGDGSGNNKKKGSRVGEPTPGPKADECAANYKNAFDVIGKNVTFFGGPPHRDKSDPEQDHLFLVAYEKFEGSDGPPAAVMRIERRQWKEFAKQAGKYLEDFPKYMVRIAGVDKLVSLRELELACQPKFPRVEFAGMALDHTNDFRLLVPEEEEKVHGLIEAHNAGHW